MSIIRTRKDTRFFAASNESFEDARLSWEARGLMGYLLSKPDGWEVSVIDLRKKGPAGDEKLRRMLAELRKYGYMNRIRITLPNGRFTWLSEIFESPSQNPNPLKDESFLRTTSYGRPTSGSVTSGLVPDIVSTDLTSTDSVIFKQNTAKIFQLYASDFGNITERMADTIKDTEQDYPQTWILEAMQIAVEANKQSWGYVKGILKRSREKGKSPKENAKTYESQDKKASRPTKSKGDVVVEAWLKRISGQNNQEIIDGNTE